MQAGLQSGDTILMRLRNKLDFPITYLVTLSVGLAPVPTSVAPKKSQIDKIVTDFSPCLIFRDPELTIATDIPEITPKELHDLRRLPPAI